VSNRDAGKRVPVVQERARRQAERRRDLDVAATAVGVNERVGKVALGADDEDALPAPSALATGWAGGV
jgi:hypothetical protein